MFDRDALYAWLLENGMSAWAADLRRICETRLCASAHGTMPRWIDAWQQLPDISVDLFDASQAAVTVESTEAIDREKTERALRAFHPWRKGPFRLFGIAIDTEWRSDWKWARLADRVAFQGERVLDIGSGNGYYGWRMLAAGARLVLGCDPFLLYVAQYEVLQRYAPLPHRHFVVPIGDTELPDGLSAFDITLSMGVLYHRTSPIDHLQKLAGTLRRGGILVLETLIVEDTELLVPQGRYAKMRNVWFIPSVSMLQLWLRRCGFERIEVLDINRTSVAEQRRTAWMTFESLADFLDPADSKKTIEGYPAPLRVLVTARKR